MSEQIIIDYEVVRYRNDLDDALLIKWIRTIIHEINYQESWCNILFCSSDTIKSLNTQYRQKDSVTDVLSFSQVEGERVNFAEVIFLGDIVICYTRASEQASEFGVSLMHEVLRLILHGILHLIGHDHEQDNGDMEKIEKVIFTKLIGDFS